MIIDSYFGELASSQNMQFLLDQSQLRLERQTVWRNWLNVGLPQASLTFEQVIGRDRIAAAASVVDPDAPAPLRSRNALERYSGTIPTMKEKFRMNQSDMRSLEVIKNLPLGNRDMEIARFMNKDLEEAAVAGDKRVDIMLLQAVSTLSVDVSVTNNPDGVAFGTVSLLPQDYQFHGVATVWTNTASTPITDILTYTQTIWNTRGRSFGKMVMSYDLWLNFMKTTEVKNLLQTFFNVGKANATFAVTLDNVNQYLQANNLPQIEVIQHVAHIEVDGKPTFIKPFNVNNVAFIPDGKIGTLFHAYSMEEVHRVANKTYAKFGPTLVSKWAENDPLVEFTAMEMNAFPAVDIDNIFILKTNEVEAWS